ncbi:asparagine synthase (glutamine-hydrolyzing) [Patescibacteria group bacterium]|nr:asparagine synthase (glutamine-hydrolyzing) [Patescibacteria group bacterium]
MCGIAGIVTRDGAPSDEGLLRRMSDAIAHRGPDAAGVWRASGVGLVHRRLSIIDLSPNGNQPMTDVTGRFTIVFNGEIYNFQDLKKVLEQKGSHFQTTSDTEVILEGYRQWGADCVKHLRGMFAFAIWDSQERTLILARDRVGKKPLFYHASLNGDVRFASELKALASVVPMVPDMQAVRLFLGLQYVPSPKTGFVGVEQLPPGSFAIWKEGELHVEKYHEWERGVMATESSTQIDDRIRELFEESVKIRQLAADVPVGAFLSGGIDSAAVVAYASKYNPKLQTFTMGFPELSMDERREAREISNAFGTDHHEFEARPEQLQELVDELVAHYDAPFADSSALPLWLLAKETSASIKVVLTGDGGDELFGGYRRYAHYERAMSLARGAFGGAIASSFAGRMGRLLRDPRIERMSDVVRALRLADPSGAYGEMFCGSYFGSERLADCMQSAFAAETISSDAVKFVAKQMGGSSQLDAAMYFDFTSYLPDDLNVKMDRATMRFGLEARAPFLDQELAAYALRLPLSEKVHDGHTKIAFRRAMKGIVPDAVLDRPKRGFQVPLAAWFRGPLRQLIHDRCLDSASPLLKVMKPEAIQRLISENQRGADHGNRLWMMLTLSSWLSKYKI